MVDRVRNLPQNVSKPPSQALPLLYNFRRCPYAMRARLALIASGMAINVRDIVLKHKPEAMLALSPKGTVPVLQLVDGTVLEESADIVFWALRQQDPHQLLRLTEDEQQWVAKQLQCNDGEFKYWLDRYKYADRHPELSQQDYFDNACATLQRWELQLARANVLPALGQAEQAKASYLLGRATVIDILLVPFVRQFASVNKAVFNAAPLPHLRAWLAYWLNHPWFSYAMQKRPIWLETGEEYTLHLPSKS